MKYNNSISARYTLKFKIPSQQNQVVQSHRPRDINVGLMMASLYYSITATAIFHFINSPFSRFYPLDPQPLQFEDFLAGFSKIARSHRHETLTFARNASDLFVQLGVCGSVSFRFGVSVRGRNVEHVPRSELSIPSFNPENYLQEWELN